MTWSSKATACGQVKPLSTFASVLFSGLEWSTCLEPSSVASCNGELVAPLGIAHVWHESVVERITWQEETLINSNVTEKKMSEESTAWIIERETNNKKTTLIPHQESQNQSISVESHWSYERLGGNRCCSTWWVHHSLPLCSSGSQILPTGRWPQEYAPCPKRERKHNVTNIQMGSFINGSLSTQFCVQAFRTRILIKRTF